MKWFKQPKFIKLTYSGNIAIIPTEDLHNVIATKFADNSYEITILHKNHMGQVDKMTLTAIKEIDKNNILDTIYKNIR